MKSAYDLQAGHGIYIVKVFSAGDAYHKPPVVMKNCAMFLAPSLGRSENFDKNETHQQCGRCSRNIPDTISFVERAYYSAKIDAFLSQSSDSILGKLTKSHSFEELALNQTSAWLRQIEILQFELKPIPEGLIAFEFAIPRMGKRADVVLVHSGIIYVLEFKVGADDHEASAVDQSMDYALDLKNFHAGSHHAPIVPVLISTEAPAESVSIFPGHDLVCLPVLSNGQNLIQIVSSAKRAFPNAAALDAEAWLQSGYKPTPTIVEAAQALYRGHKVEEITKKGAANIDQTEACIARIIEHSKSAFEKAICFVTGVPGAGKTLAGLNLATNRADVERDDHAVFLSGNGPLVDVLREALVRDKQHQLAEKGEKISKKSAARKVNAFIQNIHHFRDENLATTAPPSEHVAVFDEAQRAWDSEHLNEFMLKKKRQAGFDASEPEFLLRVFDRHPDWCTLVCLIGGGQEIHAGEAGLPEWFIALRDKFPNWKVYSSPQLNHPDYHWGKDLKSYLAQLKLQIEPDLHLAVSARSFRAERQADFIGAVINGDQNEARKIYLEIKDRFPIAITRELDVARLWLKQRARGSERFGLVASSGAHRLKSHGISVRDKITATYWFLNDKQDVRSSFYLESPGTEFDVQGLELDWVGACWDGDFRWSKDSWSHHAFRGPSWVHVNNSIDRTYLANSYRVLLTRARQGMVIFVPRGDTEDHTRDPEFYDGTWSFLKACGIEDA